MKGEKMKNYLATFLCLILLITSIIFLPTTSNSEVMFGAGAEENEKITNLEDMVDFLAFLSNENDQKVLSANTGINYAPSLEENEDDGEDIKQYNSGTIDQTAYIKSFTAYGTENYSVRSTQTINRTLSIYLSEEASYYHSKASMDYQDSRVDYNNQTNSYNKSLYIVWDMEIYIAEDMFLVKFNSFYGYDKEEDSYFSASKDSIGKWIRLPDTYIDFDDLDSFNRESLSLIGDCILGYIEDGFVKKGNVYTLKEKYAIDEDITIDLNTSENPTIELNQNYESSINSPDGRTFSSQTLDSNYSFEFKNINNTIVSISDDVEIYDFDDFDWEGLEYVF